MSGMEILERLDKIALIIFVVLFTLAFFAWIISIVSSWFAKRRGPRMTKEEVADVIERFINDESIDDEWDEFECVPINDPYLDGISEYIVGPHEKFPEEGKYCSEEGVKEMKAIVEELRRNISETLNFSQSGCKKYTPGSGTG
jgi:hypothetical protein